jgi:hypothetical protein
MIDNLAMIAASFFLGGLWISSRVLRWPTAVVVSSVKVFVPFIYFEYFSRQQWTFLDDVTYFEFGRSFVEWGYNPITIFLERDAIANLMMLSGGRHIMYGWYNFVAQWAFGTYYYSPVFLNIGLTFFAGLLLYRLAIANNFSKSYARGLFVFFLLHWELLTWTSFVNLKESLVMFLTIASVYAGLKFMETKRQIYAGLLIVLVFLFYWVRFYVPLLLLSSFLVNLILFAKGYRRIWLCVAAFSIAVVYGFYVGWGQIMEEADKLVFGGGIADGAFKVAVTPRPWSIDPIYSFLLVPSLIHWVLFVPTILGCVMLWRGAPKLRLLLIYLVMALCLYGSFEELQGPRHRLQLVFIYGWAQFHFIWRLFRAPKPSRLLTRISAQQRSTADAGLLIK